MRFLNSWVKMNILIVDDSTWKAGLIRDCILQSSSNHSIHIAPNAFEADAALKLNAFQLIFLDVILPLKKDMLPSSEGSAWLIRQIARFAPAFKRPMIIGTTQFQEALYDNAQAFRDNLYCVISVRHDDHLWQRTVRNGLILASQTVELSTNAPLLVADVAILTALRHPEFSELCKCIGPTERISIPDTSEQWFVGDINCAAGKTIRFVIACADDMGSCAMSSLTTRIFGISKPKAIFLTGIMGGNAKRVGIGDLVCVSESWDYKAGKITSCGFEADVKCHAGSQPLMNGMRGFVEPDLLEKIHESWPGKKPTSKPSFHVGAVACSAAVISSESEFSSIESQKRKAFGVEMEAYGFYDAASRLGVSKPEVICLKAVCDLGDSHKGDDFQSYCAFLSAETAISAIRAGCFTFLK